MKWKLINAIRDDPSIRNGLYPKPGQNASTAQGGGKPKTEFYFALAIIMFKEHPAFNVEKMASVEKSSWADKVKNCLMKSAFQPTMIICMQLTTFHDTAFRRQLSSTVISLERQEKGSRSVKMWTSATLRKIHLQIYGVRTQ